MRPSGSGPAESPPATAEVNGSRPPGWGLAAASLRPELLLSQLNRTAPADLPIAALQTPADLVDLRLLEDQLLYLRRLADEAGAKILLAQKAYSLYATYPLIGRYLDGTTASGLYEARLGHEEMPGREVHVYKPAYTDGEVEALCRFVDHIVFNSFDEWRRWRPMVEAAQAQRGGLPSPGLRINPEYSEVRELIYNPAAPYSRLGITAARFRLELEKEPEILRGIEGLHFHSLCEEGAEALLHTVAAVEEKFADWLCGLRWLNLGGGHHLTRSGYQVPLLLNLLQNLKSRYGCEIYLEPGEAIALDTGWLAADVLDLVDNERQIAILDCSASCHMPDVLEMPYKPRAFVFRAAGLYDEGAEVGEKPYDCRLAGPTCLAGDIIGDYSFDAPLRRGDRILFCDLAIYAHVKRNSFNGMPLPSVYLWDGRHPVKKLLEFGYEDFRRKLGRD